MSFYVDIVTEDSFYENLTLGVIKVLENSPCVKDVRVERRNGCDRNAIANWEQRHCCILPEDVRDFYASVDGFLLLWNLEIAGEEFPIGRMEVNSLSTLKRYTYIRKESQAASEEASCEVSLEKDKECDDLSFTSAPQAYKFFEICQCFPGSIGNGSGKRSGKIYLVYRSRVDQGTATRFPVLFEMHFTCINDLRIYDQFWNWHLQESVGIWLYIEETDRWYHLADNFTAYFRAMLIHLGLPLWQWCIAGLPMAACIEQIYFLVAPHLPPGNMDLTEWSCIPTSLSICAPTNPLDPSVFKYRENKQKSVRKK